MNFFIQHLASSTIATQKRNSVARPQHPVKDLFVKVRSVNARSAIRTKHASRIKCSNTIDVVYTTPLEQISEPRCPGSEKEYIVVRRSNHTRLCRSRSFTAQNVIDVTIQVIVVKHVDPNIEYSNGLHSGALAGML